MRLERQHTLRDGTRWHASDGPGAMSAFIGKVVKLIEHENGRNGEPAWQILSVTTELETEDECSVCIFVISLPNGLTVEIEYDSAHAQEVFYDLEITDVEWAANFFDFGYSDLRYRDFDKIAAAVQETLMLLRSTFQEWSDQHGVEAHLVGSKVTWNIWDRYNNVVPHVVSISALDEDLRPSVLECELDCFGDKAGDLKELFDLLSCRRTTLQALRSQGADGKIDLLALRSLAAQGPLEDNLRNWACTKSQGDCRDHYYSEKSCHIRLHRRIPSEPNIELEGSLVRLCGMHLPESVVANCIGSPITDIIDFEHFTSDMTILEASNGRSSHGNFVRFEIHQPVYFFCSLSGRYWL